MHITCKKGYIDIVQYLIEKAQPNELNARKKNGMTPAMLAVTNNHLFVLKCLHNAGADLKLTLANGNVNLLYLAAQKGQAMIVGYLLDSGVFAKIKTTTDLNEETPIQVATKHGFVEVVQTLI